MPKLDILWEGKLSLDYIKWNNINVNRFKFSNQYKADAESYWDNHIKLKPNDYDGTLIFLDEFHFNNKQLFLDVGLIKFSMASYMLKEGIALKEGLGVLGVQYLIFSTNLKYLLIGQRALSQSYFPGATSIPGGILEISDLEKPPKIALTRELFEEVGVSFDPNYFLRAILGAWNNISITFLISAVVSESYKFNPNEIILSDKSEWEEALNWCSITSIQKMTSDSVLDGLYYYQSKLIKNEGIIE